MSMEIEDHEIHEYENTKIMKTMESKEIHEAMNLKTRMSKKIREPCVIYWRVISGVLFYVDFLEVSS